MAAPGLPLGSGNAGSGNEWKGRQKADRRISDEDWNGDTLSRTGQTALCQGNAVPSSRNDVRRPPLSAQARAAGSSEQTEYDPWRTHERFGALHFGERTEWGRWCP
jgi:hypothetical protein